MVNSWLMSSINAGLRSNHNAADAKGDVRETESVRVQAYRVQALACVVAKKPLNPRVNGREDRNLKLYSEHLLGIIRSGRSSTSNRRVAMYEDTVAITGGYYCLLALLQSPKQSERTKQDGGRYSSNSDGATFTVAQFAFGKAGGNSSAVY